MKYQDLIHKNTEIKKTLKGKEFNISVLSNITVNQVKEILEFNLRSQNVNAVCRIGNYDNIVQDSLSVKDVNVVILFWELANIIDGLQYKANLMSDAEMDDLIEKQKSEIDFVFANLSDVSHLIVNSFSTLVFNYPLLEKNNYDKIKDILNEYLVSKLPQNATLIQMDKIIAKLSVARSVDLRFYYSTKALYSVEFFKEYANFVLPVFMSLTGKAKKALIFDCDNTLWKGIIGEDGLNQIAYSSTQKNGTPFEEVQTIARSLSQDGILLGLCSKNNSNDVLEVFSKGKMTIKEDDLTIQRVNWNDKVMNLKSISESLNIGLDSLVFIDDSDFEINFVRENLPEITTIKVPSRLYEYPSLIRENLNLFHSVSRTSEDRKRLEMYKEQVKREDAKKTFNNLESYLKSLQIQIRIYQNDYEIIPRMSQMSLKTNQFNLTTKRYSESDIKEFLDDNNTIVFAIAVKDKFGDNGITGLAILKMDKFTAELDTFLLSCRIIGRKVELKFFDYIVSHLKKINITSLNASYIPTLKNGQVKEFLPNLGFRMLQGNEQKKNYAIELKNYKSSQINYMKVDD